MSEHAFVRGEMLPPQAPPVNSIGFIAWLRANLFSSWVNAILTLSSLGIVIWLLANVIPWVWSPTWGAGSLSECREVIAALGKHEGACWGVVRERWVQMIFGFYPSELYWRPILAFFLLFVALAPVLFRDQVPGAILYFSAVYPFLFPWLLWGGPIWTPLAVVAGFVIGYYCYRAIANMVDETLSLVLAVLLALVWWFFLATPFSEFASDLLPIGLEPVDSRKFGGLMLSVTIGVVAIACSLPIGILLALGRQSDLLIVKAICVTFIEFIRGVPLITLLLVASTLLNIFLPPGTEFDIILRVLIMVTLFASAYMAEVIRGGLAALPRGQYEGADSLGLSYWQAQRLIIMPQALKISIPGIVSTFIGVFKDTTLVSIISLLDPLGFTNSIRADANWNGIVWELYGYVAVMFFVFCYSMSQYSKYLERKLQTDHQ